MHENEERTPAEIAHYKNRLSLFRRFVVRLEEFKTKLKASGGKSYTEEWVGKDEKGYKVLNRIEVNPSFVRGFSNIVLGIERDLIDGGEQEEVTKILDELYPGRKEINIPHHPITSES